jgi:hypothetical protein
LGPNLFGNGFYISHRWARPDAFPNEFGPTEKWCALLVALKQSILFNAWPFAA